MLSWNLDKIIADNDFPLSRISGCDKMVRLLSGNSALIQQWAIYLSALDTITPSKQALLTAPILVGLFHLPGFNFSPAHNPDRFLFFFLFSFFFLFPSSFFSLWLFEISPDFYILDTLSVFLRISYSESGCNKKCSFSVRNNHTDEDEDTQPSLLDLDGINMDMVIGRMGTGKRVGRNFVIPWFFSF